MVLLLFSQYLGFPGLIYLRTIFCLQLEKSENESHWKLLNIFAFGTYSDYKGKIDSLQKNKQNAELSYTTVKGQESKATKASFTTFLLEQLLL